MIRTQSTGTKCAAIVLLLLLVQFSNSRAQFPVQHVSLFPIPVPESCIITEPVGVMTVYVVCWALGTDCVLAVAFRVISGGGFTGTYLGETILHGLGFGNTQDGIAVIGITQSLPVAVAAINYMTDGSSPPCSWLDTTADPGFGYEWDSCDGELLAWTGRGPLVVNAWQAENQCENVWCLPVATEEHTWGKVKSLYQR